jgi:uncharacterized Zn-finger protein
MSEPILPDTAKPATFHGELTRTGHRRVACSGPASGRHPKVYLTMVDDAYGNPSHVVCPYCSHTFEYDPALAKPGSHH